MISNPVAAKLTQRVMSSGGKKKIALALKDRWARIKKAAKKAPNTEQMVEKTIKAAKVVRPTKAPATAKAIKKAPAPAANTTLDDLTIS